MHTLYKFFPMDCNHCASFCTIRGQFDFPIVPRKLFLEGLLILLHLYLLIINVIINKITTDNIQMYKSV